MTVFSVLRGPVLCQHSPKVKIAKLLCSDITGTSSPLTNFFRNLSSKMSTDISLLTFLELDSVVAACSCILYFLLLWSTMYYMYLIKMFFCQGGYGGGRGGYGGGDGYNGYGGNGKYGLIRIGRSLY